MKLDTDDKKIAYLLGYLQAMAEQHAKEYKRDIKTVKRELLESALLVK